MRKRGKIVLLHFVGQMPLAGIAWQAINHLAALEKLGYDVWYVEDHGANPYDPWISSIVTECGYNVAYLRAAMERHGLPGAGPTGTRSKRSGTACRARRCIASMPIATR